MSIDQTSCLNLYSVAPLTETFQSDICLAAVVPGKSQPTPADHTQMAQKTFRRARTQVI
jgi:hypothetical protein